MSNAIESQGTTLEIATGTGSAATISGITLGAITEITATAHGLSVGDVVTFAAISGTTQLNGVSAMIIAKETNSFFIDVDSSGYSAYTSGGSATPNTYTFVSEITDFDGPGNGSASVIDVSHLSSTRKEKRMGLPDEGQCSISFNFIPGDTGQEAIKTSRAARSLKGYRITLSDDSVATFDAYCLSIAPSGSVDGKVTGKMTLEITGEVSWA